MNLLLKKLVAVDSQFPQEEKLGKFLDTYLRNLGFDTKRVSISKNRFNILASRGVSKKKILFYGHLDTVPLVDLGKWKSIPYKLTKVGGKLFGLGAYDMKGGISSFMQALSLSKAPAKVFLAVDEENISEGAWSVVRKNKSFFKDVSLVISAEPDFGLGINSLTNKRTGRYVFDVEFTGKKAHMAEYKRGIDAIQLASVFLSDLYRVREKLFGTNGSVVQARKIYSESIGMSVSGKAHVELEVLASHKENIDSLLLKLSKLTNAKITLRRRKTPYLQGYSFTDIPYEDTLKKIIKRNTGKDMKFVERKSVADDNVLATLGVPVVTWGPSGGNAHSENEYVLEEDLKTLTKMYTELLENIR